MIYLQSLNNFDNCLSYASAESFNSKIKAFRSKFHCVNDTKFFIVHLCNLYFTIRHI